MKQVKNLFWIVAIALAMVISMAASLTGCDDGTSPGKKTLVSIAITTPPTKTVYAIGETIDLSGLVVTATYSDGSTVAVSISAANVKGFDSSSAGSKKITISYEGQTATFDVTVSGGISNQTPAAADFTISGLSHIFDGNPKTVSITPKQGKSTGTITIYYDGKTAAPSAIGSYPVTFDVAAASGWNAKTGLSAGTLEIAKQTDNPETPTADDFEIGNLSQTAGSVTAVTITPKAGKSGGAITIFYNGSTTLPTAVGSYPVTFDVAAATGWNAKTGLSAGTLVIADNQSTLQTVAAPTASPTAGTYATAQTVTLSTATAGATIHYTINGSTPTATSTQYTSPISVTVTTTIKAIAVKSGMNDSAVLTAAYTINVPSNTPITSVSLTITAPVRDAVPATMATGSGNFTIGTVTWLPADNPFQGGKAYSALVTLTAASGYTFTGLTTAVVNGQTAAVSDNTGATVKLSYVFPETDNKSVMALGVQFQPSKMNYNHGDALNLAGLIIQIIYTNSSTESVPLANFAARNITANPANGDTLSVSAHNGQPVTITYGSHTVDTGSLTVSPINPVLADFIVSGAETFTYDGSVRTVTVTAKDGKTTGTVTVKYDGSETAPTDAGTYLITIDVTADTNYTAVNGLSAGTLTINDATPTTDDFTINGTGSFTYDGSAKTVTVTAKEGKTGGTITVKYDGSETAPTDAGTYPITIDVTADTNYTAVNGLSVGTLTINKLFPPVAFDFDISNLSQAFGHVTAVTVTPKSGKSDGTITIYYEGTGSTTYTKSTAIPLDTGAYSVTFDVAEATNWNAATNLSAGTLTINKYELGGTGPGGGIIFYYNAAGFAMTYNNQVCHYLEAAPNDLGYYEWQVKPYNGYIIYDPGTGTEIGTGRSNTNLIYSRSPAANACRNYRGPNYLTDWFLPSYEELNQLYVNRSYVGNMAADGYWSSSQRDRNNAYSKLFITDSYNWSYYEKNSCFFVRAVRAF